MTDTPDIELENLRQPQQETAFYFVENVSLDCTINDLLFRIQDIEKHVFNEVSTEESLETTISKIKNLEIDHSTIENLKYDFLKVSTKNKRAKTSTFHSLIHISLAKIAQANNQEVMAWRAVSKAEYYLGLAEGLTDPYAEMCKKRSQSGGKQKAKNAKDKKILKNNLHNRIIAALAEVRSDRGHLPPRTVSDLVATRLIAEREVGEISFSMNEDDLRSDIFNLIIESASSLK